MVYLKNHGEPYRGEVNSEASMTIPDMSMSLNEIIRKHRLGVLPAQLVRDVLYDECDDFDSVLAEYKEGYDLVDKQAELQKLRQKFNLMHEKRNQSKETFSGGSSAPADEPPADTPAPQD